MLHFSSYEEVFHMWYFPYTFLEEHPYIENENQNIDYVVPADDNIANQNALQITEHAGKNNLLHFLPQTIHKQYMNRRILAW